MRVFNQLKFVYLFVLFISIAASSALAQRPSRVSFQTFYNELEPHGRWFNDPHYGYIWAPDAGPDFRPYASSGHWVLTEYGNTWVSDYSWGWAPFHYGRWEFDSYYGWFWIPDYEWGPGWVSWRSADGYYGWAPMGYRVEVSYVHWIFVPRRYIVNPRFYSHCVSGRYVDRIYRRSRRIDNYYDRDNRRYVYGPRRYDIERATRSRVEVYRINDMDRPGRPEVIRGSIKIYRPEMDREDRSTARPSRITDSRDRGNNGRSENRSGSSDRVERSNSEGNNSSTRPERPSRGSDSSVDRTPQEGGRTENSPIGRSSGRSERATGNREGVENRGRNEVENGSGRISSPQVEQTERARPQREERSSERSSVERVETNTRSQERREASPQRQESSERSSNSGGRPGRSR